MKKFPPHLTIYEDNSYDAKLPWARNITKEFDDSFLKTHVHFFSKIYEF